MGIRHILGRGLLGGALALTLCTSGVPLRGQNAPQPTTFYVDCSAASNGDARSQASPWNNLDSVNTHTFSPGDTLRFRRGTECVGTLLPQGSGSEQAPIRLTAYGEGDRPKIAAPSGAEESLKLYQQEYWDIDSLELTGGMLYGVFVSGKSGILHHIHLSNLVVHDVGGAPMKNKDNGLVVIIPGAIDQHFDDILVDSVTAYNTRQWMGIMVGGGNFGFPPESTWSTHVVVRNSTVHDVQGDGIVIFRGRDGLIDSSVAWNTGMQVTESIGTPNAIWTWMCHDCTVSNSEAFLTDSPGVDGGAFDIDYGNTNNILRDSYGHDTQGYCVAVFGAGGVTHQSTVRGNVCLNNGRSPRMAQFQGAIFVHTWNGGALDGVTISDNSIYWNPPGTAPMLVNDAAFQNGNAAFRNNAVYSTSPALVSSNTGLSLDENRYLYAGAASPWWQYSPNKPAGFAEYQKTSSQDQHSQLMRDTASTADPLFPSSGLLQVVPDGHATATGWQTELRPQKGKWQIYCGLSDELDSMGLLNADARRQLAVLTSLNTQFHSKGLDLRFVLPRLAGSSVTKNAEWRNAMRDAGINQSQIVELSSVRPGVVFFSPDGRRVAAWQGFVGPAQIGPLVRLKLGTPAYSQIEADAK